MQILGYGFRISTFNKAQCFSTLLYLVYKLSSSEQLKTRTLRTFKLQKICHYLELNQDHCCHKAES